MQGLQLCGDGYPDRCSQEMTYQECQADQLLVPISEVRTCMAALRASTRRTSLDRFDRGWLDGTQSSRSSGPHVMNGWGLLVIVSVKMSPQCPGLSWDADERTDKEIEIEKDAVRSKSDMDAEAFDEVAEKQA